MQLIKSTISSVILMLCLGAMPVAFAESPAKHDKKTIVLDIYITGDSSIKGDKEDNALKIAYFSEHLREELQAKTKVDVINNDEINRKMAEVDKQQNLHTCNKCDEAFAKEIGADLIFKPNVFRMSHLISALHVEIVDAETGTLIKRKAYDFRGNTDNAWERVIRYAIRDLAEWQP